MRTVIVQAACDFCGKPFEPEELAWDGVPVAFGGKHTYLVDVCDPCLTGVSDKTVGDVFSTINSQSRISEAEPAPKRKQGKRLRKPYTQEEGPFYCHAVDSHGVCGRKFERYQGLGTHLTRTHRITGPDKIPLLEASRKIPGQVESA